MTSPIQTTDDNHLLRAMRFRDLFVYGLIFIGPGAAVGVFGTLDAKSNGAVAMVYLLSTIVMGLAALSYSQMSMAVPKAGAVYSYASAGIGPKAGFLTGWMVLLDYLLIPAVAYLFTGIALNSFIPSVPAWIWTSLAVIITTGLNLAGVKKAASVTIFVLLAEIIIVGMVIAAGSYELITHGAQRPWLSPLIGYDYFSIKMIIGAVSVAILSFLGFDAIATFAEENAGGKHLIGKATMLCLIIAGILFATQTYIGALLTPQPPSYFVTHPELQGKAFYTSINISLAPWLAIALALAKAIGAAFSAMVAQAASSRLLYSMSHDGRIPRQLSKVSKSTGTPVLATLTSAVITMIIAVIAAKKADGLDQLVSFVDIGAMVAFVMLHVSVIGFFLIKNKEKTFIKHGILPICGAIALLPVIYFAKDTAQIAGGIWALIGIGILLFRPEKIAPVIDAVDSVKSKK